MAGLGRKIFSAGDVLTASDTMNYLMDQTVMNFAGTAARSSAIATPTDGQVTYNQSNDQIEAYNGSAWIGMSGLQLIKKQTIGSAVSTVTVTNAFSATYDNYKIIVNGGTMAAENIFSIRMGATVTGYYGSLTATTFAGVATNAGYSNVANLFIGAGNTTGFNANIEVGAPFLARPTTILSAWSRILTTGYAANVNGFLNDSTSYTDFTLATSSSWTGGTIYVYGYGT